jgi:hypothetical protein
MGVPAADPAVPGAAGESRSRTRWRGGCAVQAFKGKGLAAAMGGGCVGLGTTPGGAGVRRGHKGDVKWVRLVIFAFLGWPRSRDRFGHFLDFWLAAALSCADLCTISGLSCAREPCFCETKPIGVADGKAGRREPGDFSDFGERGADDVRWRDSFEDFSVFCSGGGDVWFLGVGGGNEVGFDKTLADGIILPDFRILHRSADFELIVWM